MAPKAVFDQIEDLYPLSPMQQDILAASVSRQGTGAYVSQRFGSLSGDLDLARLERAWRAVIDRHSVLRTSFVWDDVEEPVQAVHRQAKFVISHNDWRHLSPVSLKRRMAAYLESERRSALNLFEPPLMRAATIRTNENEWQFVWTYHHLILDGWSWPLLIKEVLAFYTAYSRNEKVHLPSPRPYRDYISWLKQQDTSEAERFWASKLKGFLLPTPLCLDELTLRQDEPNRRGDLEVRLSRPRTAQLASMARQTGLTMNTLVQSAWGVLLSQYSGHEDIVFGTVVSCRPSELPGSESMIGLFINTLPLRVRLNYEESVLSYLKCLQSEMAEMRLYDYSLLTKIQGWSELPGEYPLFESLVVFENYPVDVSTETQNDGPEIHSFHFEHEIEATLGLIATPGTELILHLVYDASRFRTTSIERFLRHFQSVLEQFAAAPGRKLATLHLLSDAETQQLLYEWNDTTSDPDAPDCVHKLFQMWEATCPDSIAAVFESMAVTYAEINRRANQLARYLRRLSVGPESLIGVYFERSINLMVGVLAILKSGAAYLPLDVAAPVERVAAIMEDAGIPVVLTQEDTGGRLPAGWVDVVELDRQWNQICQESADEIDSFVGGDNTAYVIYTSGSTGQPKGVVVRHQSVANITIAQICAFRVHRGSRVLQFASLSVDASVPELFTPLCCGAVVCLAGEDALMPGAGLTRLLEEMAITDITLPPSALALLPDGNLRAVETVISAGEPCTPDIVGRWASGRLLVNGYGPTEATVGTAMSSAVEKSRCRCVGRPFPNVRVHILNSHLQFCPVQVVGELHVAGMGLARGYLKAPALTASKFIPDPHSDMPGARLYRTGDLARYLPDGCIECLGRADLQVKVRGYRVELGEIEAALEEHPAVTRAAVSVREEPVGGPRLVAFVSVCLNDSFGPNEEQLYRLPNGLKVAQINRRETDDIYREIFENRSYLKHGISVRANAIVFDVGANIGLFTLFVHQLAPGATVYAFEPVPPIFQKLRTNALFHGVSARLFDYGLSNEHRHTTVTYYPRMAAMSGIYTAREQDEKTFRDYLMRQGVFSAEDVEEFVRGRFIGETFNCKLKRLSDVIRENDIERIDLLKIDVEKSEMDVLNGLDDADWGKIRQIVVEVHDIDGRVGKVIELLRRHGFKVSAEQQEALYASHLCNIYAIRITDREELPSDEEGNGWRGGLAIDLRSEVTPEALRAFLQKRLSGFMVPSVFVLRGRLPLMASGKVDRRALQSLEIVSAEPASSYLAPRSPFEQWVATTWQQLLGVKRVGRTDNFFDLGGHSLLATQFIARVRREFGVELALNRLFDAPTPADWASAITRQRASQAEVDDVNLILNELESLSEEEGAMLLQQEQNSSGEKA